MWTSVDLEAEYVEHGIVLSRKRFMAKVHKDMIDKFIILTSPGIETIIVPKTYASSTLRIQAVEKDDIDEKDELDAAIETVAKAIVAEIKDIPSKNKLILLVSLCRVRCLT